MKTLYLHLGTPKTATTTIQYFCYDNADVLERKGFCYPDIPYLDGTRNFKKNAHFMNRFVYIQGKQRDIDKENEYFEKGMEIVNRQFSKFDNVILSDEALWVNLTKYKTDYLPKIMEYAGKYGYTVKALVYFRRQDSYVESYWNQFIKTHTHAGNRKNVMTFDEFSKAHYNFMHPDYYQTLEKIGDIIGKENITVRSFDKVVKEKAIQEDFLNYLGLEMTDEFVNDEEISHMNTRLYGNTLEIKRIVNSLNTYSSYENMFLEYALFDCVEQSKKAYPCSTLNEAETAEFMSAYEEDNKKIADEYCGGEALFDNNYECLPKWDKNNEHFIDDVINFSAAGDIQLYRRFREQQKQLNDLKAELENTKKELKKLQKSQDRLHFSLKYPIRTFLRKIKRKLFS